MLNQIKNLMRDEEAPTAVEYALMVAGIAVAVILVVFTLGTQVNSIFQNANDKLQSKGQ
jgi:pilus assembly protein Flp/PilA